MSHVSLQGNFLVAASHMRDPNFYRSVVLMLQHSPEGAMGLVINRPSAMTISGILSQQGALNCGDSPVFTGGPVEPSSLFILHNDPRLGKTDQEIAPGVFLAGSEESFETVVRTDAKPDRPVRFRLLSGYAGWGEGQLESELARGDWQTMPANGQIVLEEDPYGIWEICMRRITRVTCLIDQEVRNPDWN
jgi:putative transcriptional regulator